MTNINSDGGNDDRRATPPADPWLETAPTSPIGPMNADPGTIMDPFGPVPTDPHPYPRRDRRGWLVAAAVFVVLVCLGGALLNPFDDGKSPEKAAPAASTPATSAPTSAPAATKEATRAKAEPVVATPPADEVVYVVSSTGKGDLASISYTDQDRDIIRNGEVKLPWRHTFRITGDKPPLVIVAQRKKGGTGEVTCSISLGGKVLATAVQRGRYAAPQCAG